MKCKLNSKYDCVECGFCEEEENLEYEKEERDEKIISDLDNSNYYNNSLCIRL